MDERPEHIDRTLQLPDGEPVILPARKAARNVVAVEGTRGGREYRSLATPLDFYIARRMITESQYDAGGRLLGLWRKGTRPPYAQMSYGDRGGGGGPVEHLPIGMFAVEYRHALEAVRGVKERRVVYLVCCEEVAASWCLPAPSRRTAERKGMLYLKSALDDLAKHFRC